MCWVCNILDMMFDGRPGGKYRDEKDSKFHKSLREYRDKKHGHKKVDSKTVHNNQQHKHLIEENYITHVHKKPGSKNSNLRRSRSTSRLGDDLKSRADERRTSSLSRMSTRNSEVTQKRSKKPRRSRSKSPRPSRPDTQSPQSSSTTSRSDVTESRSILRSPRPSAQSGHSSRSDYSEKITSNTSSNPRRPSRYHNTDVMITEKHENLRAQRQPSLRPSSRSSHVDIHHSRNSVYSVDEPGGTPHTIHLTIEDYYEPGAVFLRISQHRGVTRDKRSGSLILPGVFIMQKEDYTDEEYERLRLVNETYSNRVDIYEEENERLLNLFLQSGDGIDSRYPQ